MTQRLTQTYGESAFFSGLITPLPGCPSVAVSHALFREGSTGYGTIAQYERLRQLHRLGYSYVTATVEVANERQQHLLTKTGWSQLPPFLNRQTGNLVSLWGRPLTA